MQTGWQTIDKKKDYFSKDGAMQTGWQTIDSNKYYFGKDGVMQTGLQTIDKKSYYFNKDGIMQTGWQTIDKKKYYFSKDGIMQTGYHEISGKSYYFSGEGVLYTNTKVDGYRIDKNGIAVKIKYPLADQVLDECGRDLRSAFDWCVNTLTYYSHKTHSDMYASDTVSSKWYADFGFKNKKGNCYVYAATFYELACELGYEAYHISGTVPLIGGGAGPHSWVEIVIDGIRYAFDTEACWQYKQSGVSYNGYMFRYGEPGTWVYNYGKIMND